MIEHPELTEFGRLWAEANVETSLVARVSLLGYDSDWPFSHVSAAIREVNARGAAEAGAE